MLTALNHYLETIRNNLSLDLSEEREIISELETHIEDSVEEMEKAGLSEEETTEKCLGILGSAKLVAHQLYEAHSQGSWKQALLASSPHLLFGLLFALNWWHHAFWLSAMLVLTFGATLYGWLHGKPTWVFSWLGYSLLPILIAGICLRYLPLAWSLWVIPFYFLLALWWLGYIVVQTLKRDWLFSSLMLLPIPAIIGWFLVVAPEGRVSEYSIQCLYDFTPWIALTFMALSLTIIAFIRLRKRWLKTAFLAISGLLTLGMVAYYAEGRLSLPAFLVLIVLMWVFFLVPPLLKHRIRWLRNSCQYPVTVPEISVIQSRHEVHQRGNL